MIIIVVEVLQHGVGRQVGLVLVEEDPRSRALLNEGYIMCIYIHIYVCMYMYI